MNVDQGWEFMDNQRTDRVVPIPKGGASRRRFLKAVAVSAPAAGLTNVSAASLFTDETPEPVKVTALITAYYPVSHADVIVSKILEGYQRNGGNPKSNLKLASMYVEQIHEHDISRSLSEKYGVRICRTIDEAITLGTNRLQVAGVLSIAEHGDYAREPETQQKMYPRRRFFDETIATFDRCGQVVPYFNDKHLSYRWSDALHMVKAAKTRRFPLLAGSSLPLTWRLPELELPRDCEIESAVTIGYGPLEDYGFHALEAHQCQIERRRGGESGIAAVRVALGNDIRKVQRAGDWSEELFAAARRAMPGRPDDATTWDPVTTEFSGSLNQPAAFLLDHKDGLKSAIVMTASYSGGFAFACKIKGRKEPLACWFKLQDRGVFGHFAYLLQAFEATIQAGRTVYPVERTLLTTGVLDRCMQLIARGGGSVVSPELSFRYDVGDWPFANHPRSTLRLPHD